MVPMSLENAKAVERINTDTGQSAVKIKCPSVSKVRGQTETVWTSYRRRPAEEAAEVWNWQLRTRQEIYGMLTVQWRQTIGRREEQKAEVSPGNTCISLGGSESSSSMEPTVGTRFFCLFRRATARCGTPHLPPRRRLCKDPNVAAPQCHFGEGDIVME